MDYARIIIPISGAIIAGLIAGVIGGPLAFLITPSFEIEYEEWNRTGCAELENYVYQEKCPNEDKHQVIKIEKTTIRNKGLAQAKNAEINFVSFDPIWIVRQDCPEGKIDNFEQNRELNLIFNRFSTNIDCYIEFESLHPKPIESITITADDTPGYQWLHGDIVVSEIYSILGIIIILVVGTTGYLIFAGYTLIKIFRTRRAFKKSMLKKESEVSSDLQNVDSELNFLDKAITMQKGKDIPAHTLKRRESLIEKILQLTNERDQLRSTSSTDLEIRNLIGEFFDQWINLEQRLLTLVEKVSEKGTRAPSFRNIQKELENKKVIEKSLIQELESLRRFRNKLAHGEIEPSKKELQSKNTVLKQLLEKVSEIKIPINHYVSIPRGSSTPGCEETNECFIPPKLIIKENHSVTWNNDDTDPHTITSGGGLTASDVGSDFDSGLFMSGDSFVFKFTKKGKYQYFCMVHPWQTGEIIVI